MQTVQSNLNFDKWIIFLIKWNYVVYYEYLLISDNIIFKNLLFIGYLFFERLWIIFNL